MQLRLQLILLFYFSRSFFCDDYEIKEENIVGLEDFLMSLDPQTSDVLLELLQAKTNNATQVIYILSILLDVPFIPRRCNKRSRESRSLPPMTRCDGQTSSQHLFLSALPTSSVPRLNLSASSL
ncbi:unnamed protein product [Caenorhabditis auriculariae]|uniref:Uncharacterized protein n=1 Tax=Caenorhabditis auriculariae TaxID=2777116 RepID=A0A8S1GZJ2_9PELO|nr:unnamed protein product [Caenorhabditis auriculariae]